MFTDNLTKVPITYYGILNVVFHNAFQGTPEPYGHYFCEITK